MENRLEYLTLVEERLKSINGRQIVYMTVEELQRVLREAGERDMNQEKARIREGVHGLFPDSLEDEKDAEYTKAIEDALAVIG